MQPRTAIIILIIAAIISFSGMYVLYKIQHSQNSVNNVTNNKQATKQVADQAKERKKIIETKAVSRIEEINQKIENNSKQKASTTKQNILTQEELDFLADPIKTVEREMKK